MYKTLENYNKKKKCDHTPFETYQRDIAQQNRQLQALQHSAKRYHYQKASGIITKNLYTSGYLDYKTKDNFCSKK